MWVYFMYNWKSVEQMKLDKNNPPWPVNVNAMGVAVGLVVSVMEETYALAKMETEKLVCCELKRKSWTFAVRWWQKGKHNEQLDELFAISICCRNAY